MEWEVEEGEGKDITCMWICMAAAWMLSIPSVPSLLWSLLSHVQSVKM